MRINLHSFLIALICFFSLNVSAVTINTSGYLNYWNGTYTSSVGVTFDVTNSNTYPIALTSVGYSPYATKQVELWYSSTSLTGGTGVINSSNPAWIQLASVPSVPIAPFAVIQPNLLTGFNLIIPAGTTYRFAVLSGDSLFFGSVPITAGPYTSGGVSLNTNNAVWGAASLGLSTTGYNFYGSITYEICAFRPSGLNATGITSTSANVSWGAVSGSVGYDYIVTTSSTPPVSGLSTTTNTSATVTGLTPATIYYLHVRNKCSASAASAWTTYQFQTSAPCLKPVITIKNVTENSADISWVTYPHAQSYEFMMSTERTLPTTGAINNTGTYTATALAEGTKYYVFIKMNCMGGETTEWAIDSFTTKIICRPPSLLTDYISKDAAVVYWKPVLSAYKYEYEISQSPTPLGNGTAIESTNFRAFPLRDGQTYYFHVRSMCNDLGFYSKSDWTTATFRTFPTSVSNVSGSDLSIEVYPNPVKDVMTVKINGKTVKGKLTLTDINGRVVYNNQDIDGQTLNVNISGFASGLYVMKYTDEAGNNQVIKVVKD